MIIYIFFLSLILLQGVARSTNDPVRAVFTDAFIERLKDRDFVRSHMQAVGSFMPRLLEVLVHERDRYMVEKLQQEQGKRIVGVVGLGHLVCFIVFFLLDFFFFF